jgi:ribosomal protein L16 Arg81 hydroxylase
MIQKLTQNQITEFSDDMVYIDPDQFANKVDVTPFSIQHQLQSHPLFQLESLVELSKRLPKEQREYVFAKQEFGTHDNLEQYKHAADNDELSTEDLINAIETQNVVIVLRNVESDHLYGEFVNHCLDSLAGTVEPVTGPISGRESFIFVSPPNAYTPYHWDPEQNFFMQVRGKKQMAIYDVADRDLLPEEALERYYTQGQVITKCPEELFENYELFEMNPGDGVYVPVTAPHWGKTLDEVSVSVSINFRSPSSIRRARVFRMNRMMRKMGLRPRSVSPRADFWSEQLKSSVLEIPANIEKRLGK